MKLTKISLSLSLSLSHVPMLDIGVCFLGKLTVDGQQAKSFRFQHKARHVAC
jgi:hypothetical protein